MKKYILLILFSFIVFYTNAQISIMPKLGLTISNVNLSDELRTFFSEELVEDMIDSKSRVGFTGGIALNIGLSESFSIQPELLFINKGFKFEAEAFAFAFEIITVPIEANFIINYLELPILAKYSFGNGKLKGYLNAGPSFSLGIGGKLKVESQGITNSADITFGTSGVNNGEDAFDNSLDFGLQFGGGLTMDLGPGQIVLDGRYGLGLSNLYEAPDDIEKNLVQSQNRSIAITLGYMIPLSKQ